MSAISRITLFLLASFLVAFNAGAWDRGKVERFATLPAGALKPEGIAVDPRSGDVYVTGFNPAGTGQLRSAGLTSRSAHHHRESVELALLGWTSIRR
jgi:hypothetical protein